MKITHISLCGPVTDKLTYQDNLLPKYHNKMELEVSMITSKHIWNKGHLDIDSRNLYFNEYGIKTIRLENKYKTNIKSKFKRYRGLYNAIKDEEPDVLFVHGVQFIDIKEIVRYAKEHPQLKIYVDNHADYSNSATNWLSKKILHEKIWMYYANLIEPYTTKFFGVLPSRVTFLLEVYKLPKEKTDLLILGADDEKVNEVDNPEAKKSNREKRKFKQDDFIIVTGGKIDKSKLQVLNLMKAIAKLNNSQIKLIVFGSVIPEFKNEIKKIAQSDSIEFVGWLTDTESYELFSIANLVVFPGRHSVYWEQVAAMGIPMIVKYWEGTTHVDIGGNCEYLYNDTVEEIMNVIKKITENKKIYKALLTSAQHEKRTEFLYSKIAKKSIE